MISVAGYTVVRGTGSIYGVCMHVCLSGKEISLSQIPSGNAHFWLTAALLLWSADFAYVILRIRKMT